MDTAGCGNRLGGGDWRGGLFCIIMDEYYIDVYESRCAGGFCGVSRCIELCWASNKGSGRSCVSTFREYLM